MKDPLPLPFGWFMIGYSDELAPGELKNVHYFARDMVLFRTESGELGLSDPYCPHLGAHIGHGGEIVGESVRCPFHHWSYDTSGVITDIPYAKQIPPKAKGKPCLKTYPVQEKNQVIWAWYHPEDAEPSYDVVQLEEFGKEGWQPTFCQRFTKEVDSGVQEIAENGVDAVHFKYIHGSDFIPLGEATYDGVTRVSTIYTDEATKDSAQLKIVQHGSGQKWVNFYFAKHIQMIQVTPINEEKVIMFFSVLREDFPEDDDNPMYQLFKMATRTLESGVEGVEGDIPIWNKKAHLRNPILCDGDGPFMQFRKYFAQFYVNGPYGDKVVDPKVKLVS